MLNIFDGVCTLIKILNFIMGFIIILIKPPIYPRHINVIAKTQRVKPLAFQINELTEIKYFRASKILSLMPFPITYLILIKEIIKHP